ncbi:endonuclease VII domain-containing protein [Noviherbaspirillum suwonense]|uniref:endonuclease VII domain-containing protein n=1 Tax=Noviherbaspirillum suwonense TaxID=1224511 RepID=UPI0024B66AC2|nr:endonuclease VII domain-containing protein [Noviherbaspirillum suwonense]
MNRHCSKCNLVEPIARFDPNLKIPKSKAAVCLGCKEKSQRKANWKKLNINISFKDYLVMGEAQNWKCMICQTPHWTLEGIRRYPAVDHDHNDPNGKIRGLLCTNCNTGLGKFHDSTHLLEAAIAYLRR